MSSELMHLSLIHFHVDWSFEPIPSLTEMVNLLIRVLKLAHWFIKALDIIKI